MPVQFKYNLPPEKAVKFAAELVLDEPAKARSLADVNALAAEQRRGMRTAPPTPITALDAQGNLVILCRSNSSCGSRPPITVSPEGKIVVNTDYDHKSVVPTNAHWLRALWVTIADDQTEWWEFLWFALK